MVDGEHSDVDLAPKQVPDGNRTFPNETLLKLLSEPRTIKGEFSSVTVPDRLMGLPIARTATFLYQHGRNCSQPRTCRDTPGPLRRFLKAHSADIIIKSAHQIHAALWTHPNTTMIQYVRESLCEDHRELADAVANGDILAPDWLQKTLDHGGDAQVELLAAMLWADGLDDPTTRDLFRLLPVFLSHEQIPAMVPDSGATPQEPSEKQRHRAKRLELQDRAKELEKQLSDSHANVRSRSKDLKRATGTIQTLETERDALKQTIEQLESRQKDLSASTRTVKTQLQESERASRRASKVSEAHRIDLEQARRELTETERERGALVRRLASARARIQELEAQMRGIPRDQEAIDDWLQREESRLRDLELIVAGGARERVVEEKRLRRKLESVFREAYPQFKQPRPPALDSTPSLKFVALGGGNEVGRSAYMVSIGIHDVLIDCGISVSAQHREDQVPDLSAVTRLDALLVTHAHTDHIGWIPALVASLDYFPIYCTKPTGDLLRVMLRDSRSHYVRALMEDQMRRSMGLKAPAVAEAYTSDDILKTEERVLEAPLGEARGVGATDLRATFFPAGHILGAASILLEGGGRRVVISGDVSSEYQETVLPFSVPESAKEVDLLVLESTYGAQPNREPLKTAQDSLVKFVADTVPGGVALLPCFALGRAQEVLAILTRARREGRLPRDLKILVDGMINKINPTYIEHAKLDYTDFIEIGGQLDREMTINSAIGTEPTPTVVVTTSGMLTGGPVIEWARRLLPDRRNRMALLGYQDEGAPGGLLRKLAQGKSSATVTLRNEAGEPFDVKVEAPVASIGLSAHADQDGLVAYAAAVRPKRTVLVHGDDDARSALRDRLIRDDVCQDVQLDQALRIP
jgi:Cft2 family RNA processing exonuclease